MKPSTNLAKKIFFMSPKLSCESSISQHKFIVFVMVLLVAAICCEAVAAPRPVYVFSHRVNDIDEIPIATRNGGNAIEIDLQFCGTGGWRVNHDNCRGSVTLHSWLSNFSSQPRKRRIAALNLDIKADTSDTSAREMRRLVEMARNALGNDILIIYSVGDWDNRGLLGHIMMSLRKNEAVNIDSSSGRSAQQKIDFFNSRNVNNFFYADGICSACTTPSSMWANLRHARSNRGRIGEVKMVYSWTFEKKSSIKEALIDERLDGLLVTDPSFIFSFGNGMKNAVEVLAENRNSIRLASRSDLNLLNLKANEERDPPLSEDCLPLNPSRATIIQRGSKFLITEDGASHFSAPNRREADKILKIIRRFAINKSCFVGRPDPSFSYVLKNQSRPMGSLQDEDCIGFNARNLRTKREGASVLLTDDRSRMIMFPNTQEANMAVSLIKKYGFSKTCYVGRPAPSFIYLK